MRQQREEQDADEVIIERVRGGDRDAFNLLVIRYRLKVMALLSRHLYNPRDVEDVAQEVFIKAYRGLNGFRGASKFYTWLYRIAVNAARNHIASEMRRVHHKSVNVEDAEVLDDSPRLRNMETPEGNILQRELSQALNASLESLPEAYRTALVLCEVDGLSYEQISDIMGCPVGTVRSRIFRARETLSESINALLQD